MKEDKFKNILLYLALKEVSKKLLQIIPFRDVQKLYKVVIREHQY